MIFAWIVYTSQAQRDNIMQQVMADMRLAEMVDPKNMPFDAKRMFWGGFKPLVQL